MALTQVQGQMLSGSTSTTTAIQSNGTTAITIDASQNVGIGTTSPSAKLHVDGTGNQYFRLSSSTNANFMQSFCLSGSTGVEYKSVYRFVDTDAGERMRITSVGKVGIGTATPNCILDLASSDSGSSCQTLNITNAAATSTARGTNRIVRISSNASGADTVIQFTDNVSNNYFFGGYNGVAYVSSNLNQGVKLSAGATSWASDSDERLKNIKTPITNAIENLSTLRTVYGNYKDDADDVSRLFLIAQDVQKVYPEVVDVYQDEQQTLGLRYPDLIPVLVSAIQEQQALITDLTTRLAALEGAK